ncbi:hypothetical protein JWG45_08870 [Leptospira sp. 201903070]|uniref:Uncharacterized protein n=1 Tax=Leptospira ainlahdjerensis TaxID=2810033 RepID=A0ABS2UDE2_9LEPT|nr:hypothetical protein [Leptospira ainlahdjerensis]MBM9577262.1 hypothetical protein [Leptospira ainlahdjerensis]
MKTDLWVPIVELRLIRSLGILFTVRFKRPISNTKTSAFEIRFEVGGLERGAIGLELSLFLSKNLKSKAVSVSFLRALGVRTYSKESVFSSKGCFF